MIRKLEQHGDQHALVIDSALMEAMGIDGTTPLQVSVSGQSLVITPANVGLGRDAVRQSLEKLRPGYADMLRKLAE